MIALIVVISILVYLACFTVVAGKWYHHIRPYREPLACSRYYHREPHDHDSYCYRRPNTMVDSNAEAMFYSMMLGLTGPLGVLGVIVAKFVQMMDGPVSEEAVIIAKRQAAEAAQQAAFNAEKIARLEREAGIR